MDYTSYFDIFVMLKVSSILLHADLWFTNTRTYLTRVWNALDSPTYQFIFFDIGKHWLKNNNVYLMITNECELTTCTENNDPPHPDIIPRTWTLIQRHIHFTLTSRSQTLWDRHTKPTSDDTNVLHASALLKPPIFLGLLMVVMEISLNI